MSDQIALRVIAKDSEGAASRERWKERFGTFKGCLFLLLLFFGPIALLIGLFKRIDLLITYGYPLCEIVGGMGVFLILPISLVLLIILYPVNELTLVGVNKTAAESTQN